MSIDTRIAELTLVACDLSYKSDLVQVGNPLAEYEDHAPGDPLQDPMPDTFNDEGQLTGWRVIDRVNDLNTGFGMVLFRKDDEVIVAMRGSDGPDPQDYYNNLHLAMAQWRAKGRDVLQQLGALENVAGGAFTGKIHFTGQSLGGALAQFAAHDWAKFSKAQNSEFDPRDHITMTTFNGLGAVGGLVHRAAEPGGAPYDPVVLAGVPTAHYVITNDIVSRLGEGNINGASNTYKLDFRASTAGTILPEYNTVVDAHRIESGFYRGFATYGRSFDFATPINPEGYFLNIPQLQQYGAYFGCRTQNLRRRPQDRMDPCFSRVDAMKHNIHADLQA
jgi:hypothetical protein